MTVVKPIVNTSGAIEKYRREVFHLLDRHCLTQDTVLFRSAHFIERLNLRAHDQLNTLKVLPTVVVRALTIEANKKCSIHIDGHAFLVIRTKSLKTKATLSILTYSNVSKCKNKHFANVPLEISLIRTRNK